MARKAIFLDRDGTINREVNYLNNVEQIKFFPDTIPALQKFKSLGFLNIIITNQSGIARGYFTDKELEDIHTEFKRMLKVNNENLIDDIFYSPFLKDGIIDKYMIDSEDRKPNTGMILKARIKHDIDLQESYLIGDSLTDMQCADKAGIKKILVSTGYGKDDLKKCKDNNIILEYYAEDLLDASRYIENSTYTKSKNIE
jgi:D,D-heptose 1,7-bisphosphate phosphatase